jgi:transposase
LQSWSFPQKYCIVLLDQPCFLLFTKHLTPSEGQWNYQELHAETRRTRELRYSHRLHGVLLVAQGLSCKQAAALLGDASRTVSYWVESYLKHGLSGLRECERPGRPGRLSEEQLRLVWKAFEHSPRETGLPFTRWHGKALAAFVQLRFQIKLSVRQCQRLLQIAPR